MTTKKEIVEFYHVPTGWPVKKILIAAIQRNTYASWPGLNEKMVQQHLETREPTVLGHMNVRRSGTQTIKKKEKKGEKEKMECILAEKNDSLKKLVSRILQSHETRVGVHLGKLTDVQG